MKLTKEECLAVAKECDSRKILRMTNRTVFNNIYINKWFEAFEHMKESSNPYGYWLDKNKCFEAAKICSTKYEFSTKYPQAYKQCCRNKWLNEACQHMVILKRPNGYWTKKRCLKAAKGFKRISDFQKEYSRAYILTLENEWFEVLDEITKS